MNSRVIGERIRRLRLVAGLGQVDFAEAMGVASGTVSKLENGQMPVGAALLEAAGRVLACSPDFLTAAELAEPPSRPWLRAYADAPKRIVDRQLAECCLVAEFIQKVDLPTLEDKLPIFTGDLDDDADIEQFAVDVRVAANIREDDVVGNTIRAAERLGCVVLPMREELGRHLGLSTRTADLAFICVSRPSNDPERHVPGDRQRFTVAHELGHLALHAALGTPETAEEAARIEKQAHLFGAAFLAPGDAMLEELNRLGGRVTLRTLAAIKEDWGIAIKALVMRFRSLGVIDAEQARSLYKQISSRGWNKEEPVPVGNEAAVWLTEAMRRSFPGDAVASAASGSGLGSSHLKRWTDWSPTGSATAADVLSMARRSQRERPDPTVPGTVTRLPKRR